MHPQKVALFELYGHKDVGGGWEGEEEWGDGKGGVHQEGKDPPEVGGRGEEPIGPGGGEAERGVGLVDQIEPDLTQAEEIEMVDEERADQDQGPAETEETPK